MSEEKTGEVPLPDSPDQLAREVSYLLGRKRTLIELLHYVMRELRAQEVEIPMGAKWALERHEAIATLRRICADHGDNNWSDNLHLSDVIEKHLGDHLPRE